MFCNVAFMSRFSAFCADAHSFRTLSLIMFDLVLFATLQFLHRKVIDALGVVPR
jgi:hypothetical protein